MKSKEFYQTKAWKYFSRYVLLYYSDGLITRCSTCGAILRINSKKCHVGHFVKVFDGMKTNFATAFEFTNVAPQCFKDNRFFSGKPDIMEKWLIGQHGQKEIDKLHIKKYNHCKLDAFTLDYWEVHYKKLFDQQVKLKGNPWLKRK